MCESTPKAKIGELVERLNVTVPDPIMAHEFVKCQEKYKNILIDEILGVTDALIELISGSKS